MAPYQILRRVAQGGVLLMNQAQRLLSGLYNVADAKAKGVYLRAKGVLADACWAMLLVYALMGGVNALLCAWAIAWDWLR